MAGISASIELDVGIFERRMNEFQRQIPFAVSKALNMTAKAGVPDTRKDLRKSRDFTIRSPWVPQGIQMRASNKKMLVAQIGSVDEFMVRQVEGGTKIDKDGGNLAIPLVGKGRARSRLRKTTPQSMWPSQLPQNDPNVFIGTAGYKKGAKTRHRKTKKYNKIRTFNQAGGGTFAVWRRLPKHRLKMVYAFRKQVEVKGRWDIHSVVEASVKQHWPAEAEKAIAYAIATSLRR